MRIRVALCSLLALASGGCATVFHGTTQAVPIVSQPAGAEVKVDGQSVGRTPVVVHVKRKNAHIVQFELAGFEPSRTTLNPQGSRAALWNLIAGTAYLGYLVDALTGGLYDLWPEVVAAPMRRTGADSVPPAPTDPAALAFGARVRVAPGPEAHGTVTGTLVRRTTDSLWIWPGRTAEAEAFPVRSVPQIDVSVGRHRNTGLGTLIGAVAGVPLGMAMASLAGCGVGWGGGGCKPVATGSLALGAAVGGAVGAGIGALIGHSLWSDIWQRAAVPRVALLPFAGPHGLGLALSVRPKARAYLGPRPADSPTGGRSR